MSLLGAVFPQIIMKVDGNIAEVEFLTSLFVHHKMKIKKTGRKFHKAFQKFIQSSLPYFRENSTLMKKL